MSVTLGFNHHKSEESWSQTENKSLEEMITTWHTFHFSFRYFNFKEQSLNCWGQGRKIQGSAGPRLMDPRVDRSTTPKTNQLNRSKGWQIQLPHVEGSKGQQILVLMDLRVVRFGLGLVWLELVYLLTLGSIEPWIHQTLDLSKLGCIDIKECYEHTFFSRVFVRQ